MEQVFRKSGQPTWQLVASPHACFSRGRMPDLIGSHRDRLQTITRLHSSRMHTTHLLTISTSMHCTGGCVSLPGGVYLPRGGGSALGRSLLEGWVCLARVSPCLGGVSLQGGSPCWRVLPCQGGGWYPNMH